MVYSAPYIVYSTQHSRRVLTSFVPLPPLGLKKQINLRFDGSVSGHWSMTIAAGFDRLLIPLIEAYGNFVGPQKNAK